MTVVLYIVYVLVTAIISIATGDVSDKEYASLPDLFHQDNFDKCMFLGDDALYCYIEYELEPPNNDNPIWKTIQKLKENKDNYRHDYLRHWICVPTACPNVTQELQDDTTLSKHINNCYDKKMLKYGLRGTIKNLMCDTNKPKYPINSFDILVACVFSIYIFVVLLCTITDNIARKWPEEDYKNFSNTRWGITVISFSLIENWNRLRTVKNTPEVEYLRPLQGVRFYNIIIVILSHTVAIAVLGPVVNTKFVEQGNSSFANVFLSSGPLCVSTMFCLSSTLLSYGVFSNFEKRKFTLKIAVLIFIDRYLRLVPSLAVVLLFNVTWWRHFGTGPSWNRVVGREYLYCRKNMWLNLLFLNNLINSETMCTPTLWYVALDTQYFMLLLLLLWYIKKNEKYMWYIIGFLLPVFMLITFYINYVNKLEAFNMPRAELAYDMKILRGNPHWHKQFSSPTGNTCGPLLGVGFGYIMHKTKNVEMFKKKTMWKVLYYLLSFVPVLAIIIIPGWYVLMLKPEYDPFVASFIAVIGRPIFILSVGFGIYGCMHGIGGLPELVLKWSPVYVLGRLAYSAYLVHFSVLVARQGVARTPIYVSQLTILYNLMADLTSAFLLALLLTLFVEMPMSALQKYILPMRPKNNEDKKEK